VLQAAGITVADTDAADADVTPDPPNIHGAHRGQRPRQRAETVEDRHSFLGLQYALIHSNAIEI